MRCVLMWHKKNRLSYVTVTDEYDTAQVLHVLHWQCDSVYNVVWLWSVGVVKKEIYCTAELNNPVDCFPNNVTL